MVHKMLMLQMMVHFLHTYAGKQMIQKKIQYSHIDVTREGSKDDSVFKKKIQYSHTDVAEEG